METSQAMSKIQIEMPQKMVDLFSGKARYRCAFGGRGSGKTRSFAIMTAVYGYKFAMEGKTGVILCAREFQNSLSESSFEEIKGVIQSIPWLNDFYEVGSNFIRTKDGLVKYVFAGLRRNLDSIKSTSRILLCWVDEAEGVSETAWMKLIPTVREEGSELFVSWNPESKFSATHLRFREDPPDNCKVVEINYSDNQFFPDVLEQERLNDKKRRPDSYEHVWEGAFLTHHDGAYYNIEMRDARTDGRIGTVPYDPRLPVVTAWDLGIGDSTAITFAQYHGSEVRIIDFYENSGVGLDHYARVLQDKGYRYDQHILPHDVRVKELGSGKSRYETLQSLGVAPITIAPQLGVDDGIQAVRSMLPLCWFDAEKCDHLIEALRAYHREYDDQRMTWKGRPEHDWSSHPADSFRYLAVGYRERNSWKGGAIKRGLKGIA
jgi:phage terminase large subunit